ncbi:MAG: rhodanese-like domain-containing protein [Fimbriimonadaceae bacterium]
MSKTISPSELKSRLDSGSRFQLIDVRSSQEFSAGHLPCAVNLPLEQVASRTADLNPHDPVVLVCQSGTRASMACQELRNRRDDVLVLTGGTTAWQEAGLPVVGATGAKLSLIRQVHLAAGILALGGAALALTVSPNFIILSGIVGAGLTLAGATGFCGMAHLLAAMPWNKSVSQVTR